jgi:hypothetical protein
MGSEEAGVTTLGRRLEALEEIAEEMRLRPFRELAAERGVPYERLMATYREVKARNAELRAQGLTEEQILEATARRIGCTVGELLAKRDELLERFG